MRLGTGPRLLARQNLRTYDSRVPVERRHLSVSLMCLRDALAECDRQGIHFYRLASQMVSLLAAQVLSACLGQLDECRDLAALVGEQARLTGIRLSVHPALDVLLGSADDDVARRGAAVATAWAALFEAMTLGLESPVVVHLGGDGDERRSAERFIRRVELLPGPVRARLALENDERQCSLQTALFVWERAGVPVVWDYLHWRCRNPRGGGAREAHLAAAKTWAPGRRPKLHFSSSSTAAGKGAPPLAREHADFADPFAFLDFAAFIGDECDVMLEARAKDLAVAKLRDDLRGLGCAALVEGASRVEPALAN